METNTIFIRSQEPVAKINHYEAAGWAVRQIVALSSVWFVVVLERQPPPKTFTQPDPITFGSPE